MADSIGEISATITLIDEKNWPEFKQYLFTLFQDTHTNANINGFRILKSFMPYSMDYFN